MPTLSARDASVWKTAKGAWGRLSGTWRQAVVWAKNNNAWAVVAGALTAASAGTTGGTQQCGYFGSGGTCTADAFITAYPVGGWGPYTYAWSVVSEDPGITKTNMTSATCRVSAVVGGGPGGKNITVKCVVTDAAGVSKTTNNVSVTLSGERADV